MQGKRKWTGVLRITARAVGIWATAHCIRGVESFIPLKPCDASVKRFPRTSLFGIKVTIRIVGRKGGSEKWVEDGCDMYIKRLKPANVELVTEWHKTDEALIKGVQSDWSKNFPVVLLDPKGKKFSSEKFSTEFYRLAEQGGSRLVYVVGGVSLSFFLAPRP